MAAEHQQFSVFLVPAREDRDWARKIIRRLAARYDIPSFEPHVTVCADPCAGLRDLETLRRVLKKAAEETEPITLAIRGHEVSEEFFKSLVISFEEEPSLQHLYQRLRIATAGGRGYELVPHLSLLYADLPLEQKKAAARTVFLDREKMHFDRLEVVTPDPEKGWRDIRKWRTFFRAWLGKPGREIRAVLFDFGGVLAEEGFRNGLRELARRQDLDPETVAAAGRRIIHESGYIVGQGTERDFWQIMRLRTNLQGSIQELSSVILRNFVPRPRMLEFARGLRGKGFLTAIASDQTDWLERLDRRDGFFREFDRVFNSYRMGKSKQDPTFFDDVAWDLGIAPGQVLLIDDTPGHVDRAASRGMRGIVFDTEDQVLREASLLLGVSGQTLRP